MKCPTRIYYTQTDKGLMWDRLGCRRMRWRVNGSRALGGGVDHYATGPRQDA